MISDQSVSIIIFNQIFLFIISWGITSCDTKERKADSSGVISNGAINLDEKATEILDHTNFNNHLLLKKTIRLKKTDHSFISEVTQLVVCQDTIMILDRPNSQLLLFDINGEYLGKIGTVGRGPGEYTNIDFFYVKPDQNEVVLWDDNTHKLHYFTLSGRYLKSIFLDLFARDIIEYNGKIYAFISKTKYFGGDYNFPYQLVIMDKKGKLLSKLLKFEDSEEDWYKFPKNLYLYDKKPYFVNYWEGTVSEISSEGLRPYMNLMRENMIPVKFTKNRDSFSENKGDFRYIYSNVMESGDFVFFNYVESLSFFRFIAQKSNPISYQLRADRPPLLLDMYLFAPIFHDASGFYSVGEPIDLLNFKPVLDSLDMNATLRDQIQNELTINDNPLIFVHQLR